ncbi:hypothetical protein EBQ91_02095, partial [bacterium]|nr:hypothetical protein [bacterium]
TGGDILIQSLQAALTSETEDALMILFSSLNQARTAYEGSARKYIAATHPLSKGQARDWSCMPGVDERLLDGLTPKRLSQEPAHNPEDIPLEEQYVQWLAHRFIRTTPEGLLPSPLYYSMVLKATLPESWSCGVESKNTYHLTIGYPAGYIEQSEKTQKDKLLAIARGLLGAKEDEEVSFAQLHQAFFPNLSQQSPSAVRALNYPAVQKFFPNTTTTMLPHQVRNFLSTAGLNVDMTQIPPSEQGEFLEHSVTQAAQQTAQATLLRVLQMTYATAQDAHDELTRLGVAGHVGSEQKDVLIIKDQEGNQQDIRESFSQWGMDKDAIKARMGEQTGMNTDWLNLINLLFLRSNTDGLDLCQSLAAAGFVGVLQNVEGEIDSAEVARELRESKDSLLALGMAYQQSHPEHYFHYYVRNETLKNTLKEHILGKTRLVLGNDYYECTPFPCQQELVTEIVGEWIAKNELPQTQVMRENLVRWLVLQRNTASIILLKANAILSSLLKESPGFSGHLFLETARQGYLDIIEVLLEAGAAVDLKDIRDKTALMYAAIRGHLAVVNTLVKAGAAVNLQDGYDYTVVMWATEKSYLNVLKALLEAQPKPDLDLKNKDGHTPLLRAVMKRDLNIVQALLDAGATVDLSDKAGKTALMFAAEDGHLDIVKALVKSGAAIDLTDHDSNTALMYAAKKGHLDVAKVLLERGAAVDLKDYIGRTALMFAAQEGHIDVVQALLERGAALSLQNRHGDTALTCAVENGHLAIIEALLNADAHLNFIKFFILHVRYAGYFSFQFKSNLNNKNIFNSLTHALKRKDDQCACILINRFVAIDFNDSHIDFRSLLFMVARNAQPATLDLLIYRSAQWRFPAFIQRDTI